MTFKELKDEIAKIPSKYDDSPVLLWGDHAFDHSIVFIKPFTIIGKEDVKDGRPTFDTSGLNLVTETMVDYPNLGSRDTIIEIHHRKD